MTLRWIGPGRVEYGYHYDFVFLPESPRLSAVDVGTMAEWVESGLSDHAPVVVQLS